MPLDISKIQALCFDVDGTLNDTDDQYVEKAIPYFRLVRFFLPGQDYKLAARRFVMWAEAPGNLLLGMPDTLGLDDELAKVTHWISQRHKARIRHFLPVAGIHEMLEKLYPHYPMAVVSARDETTSREFLRQAGIEKYFICVAGAQTVERTKPYPDPIIWAAHKMGVAPENCLMIGDTTVDIQAGKAAGAQTVGVLCGFGEEEELRKRGANFILQSTPQLADLLLS